MKKKECFKCGKTKPLNLFYAHPQMGDGHLNKCIECSKMDSQKRFDEKIKDPDFVESERTRGRKKYHKYKYKSNSSSNQESYKLKYPEKYAAKCSSGHIKPEFDGAEKHHWSYNSEHYKDVIFLTKKRHSKAHRFLVYDQERMMYRTIENVLLDSKESHLKYILHKIKTEID